MDNIDSVAYVVVIKDITERKKIEQLKKEFVSVVNHELRTPLTSIRGSLGLLVGGALGKMEEKAQKMLNIAYNNCERLIRLVNDILDIEKIEIGKLEFHLAVADLNTIAEEAIFDNQGYADKFQVQMKLCKLAEPAIVLVDHDRLMQVFTNLLSNAIKFSPAGETVTVTISQLDGKFVRVAVSDHGAGIPEDFHGRIFQKFAQADVSARKLGGTGLGLSICKAIIEKLNGKIGFSSKLNAGSTFYFDLPLWQDQANA
jgi:signal transduction histidine kinase